MSPTETRNRVTNRIWKAIDQSDLNFDNIPKETFVKLIDLVTDVALIEMDEELERSMAEYSQDSLKSSGLEQDGERVLWQGRPFLSISKMYVITDQRVRVIHGFLSKERKDIELVRIQDIEHSQKIRERILNLGDITIRSHDSSDPISVLNNVRDPEKIHELLRQAVLNARKQSGITFQEEM